jgi:hypothetical protein
VGIGVLKHSELWGGCDRQWWVELVQYATKRLMGNRSEQCNKPEGQDDGAQPAWGWRSVNEYYLAKGEKLFNELHKPELMPTWIAIQALNAVEATSYIDAVEKKEIKIAVDEAVRWTVDAMKSNARRGMGTTWLEYGDQGRERLWDQCLGFKILFESGCDAYIAQDISSILEGLRILLRKIIDADLREPTYHLLRDEDLIGMVSWEDYSLPYWCLGLINTISHWAKRNGPRELGSEDRFYTQSVLELTALTIDKEIHGALSRTLSGELVRSLVSDLVQDHRWLWPSTSIYPRVYACGEAVKVLQLISCNTLLLSAASGSDEVFIQLHKALRDPVLTAGIAENTVRYLEKRYRNFNEAEPPNKPPNEPPNNEHQKKLFK